MQPEQREDGFKKTGLDFEGRLVERRRRRMIWAVLPTLLLSGASSVAGQLLGGSLLMA